MASKTLTLSFSCWFLLLQLLLPSFHLFLCIALYQHLPSFTERHHRPINSSWESGMSCGQNWSHRSNHFCHRNATTSFPWATALTPMLNPRSWNLSSGCHRPLPAWLGESHMGAEAGWRSRTRLVNSDNHQRKKSCWTYVTTCMKTSTV